MNDSDHRILDNVNSVDAVLDDLLSDITDNENVDDIGVREIEGLDLIDPINNSKKLDWCEMNEIWKIKLNSEKFKICDGPGDGNCQFRSIETALKNCGMKINHQKLRTLVGRYINNLSYIEFEKILQSYKLEKDKGEFIGQWNPYYVKTKREFSKQIQQPGFNFEGDNLTLSILSKVLKVDFLIFDNKYNIIEISNDQYNENMIMLYYEHNNKYGHYGTIGFRGKRGKIHTILNRNNLPEEILIILDKDKFMLKHIELIYKENSQVKLNDIIEKLITRVYNGNCTINRKHMIKLVNEWLHNEKVFKSLKCMK